MAYHVHITDADRAYLDALPLSDTAKDRVDLFIEAAIARVDDAFRADLANRIQPDAPYFRRQLLVYDVWGDRRVHHVDFVVNDEHAAYGVLLLVYVEHF